MGKKTKAPGYATASYDTGGLFGSSTASKKGVKYTPIDQMSGIGNSAWSGLANSLNSLNSGDYSQDANYQVYANRLKDQMTQNYDSSVLSNLANKGLMRSSGLQSATNSFNNTIADETANLYNNYTNYLANNLASNQNVLSNLYNYITGINTGAQNQAQNVSNYQLQQAQLQAMQNASNNALYGQLAGAGASLAGSGLGLLGNLMKGAGA